MPFATGHRGVRLYYDVVGTTGPYVVLIQGLGLSSRFWFDLPRRLSVDPAQPYRVVVLDNRGVGQSDSPRGPYRMADMADDVAAVLDAAGVKSAFVTGISMGGMIAQHVALRHPARVDGLVLLATSPGMPHARLPAFRALATLVSLAFAPRNKPAPALTRLLLPKKHLPRAAEFFAEWPAALRAHPTSAASFFSQFAAAAGHSTGFHLRKIRCPTVVVTGAEDILIPPRNSHFIARQIKGSALEVLEDVGHAIPMVDETVVHRSLEKLRHAL